MMKKEFGSSVDKSLPMEGCSFSYKGDSHLMNLGHLQRVPGTSAEQTKKHISIIFRILAEKYVVLSSLYWQVCQIVHKMKSKYVWQ